jgi:thioredoxin-dependent peroxiredoxin
LIRKFDVAYFMASVDDLDTNTRFAQEHGADFPILADPDKTAANAYGVIPAGRQTASRWTFYIGPDGKILFIDKAVKVGTSGEDIAAKLAELKVKPAKK